jgi:hypothetical protein
MPLFLPNSSRYPRFKADRTGEPCFGVSAFLPGESAIQPPQNSQELTMQPPSLQHLADFSVEVGAPITVGQTAGGLRRVIPILGGRIVGPRLNGEILPTGADYQLIREDGFSTLDAHYVARLDNGALLYIANTGVRFGPPAVMAKITRGEPVSPAEVYFCTTPRFETASADHQWLLRPLFLATGARHPDCVELSIFEVCSGARPEDAKAIA